LPTTVIHIIQAVKKSAYGFLKRYFVYLITEPTKKNAFALVGGFGSLPRYSRLYLNTTAKTIISRKTALIPKAFLKRLLNDVGMVVIKEGSIDSISDALIVPDFIELCINLPAEIATYYAQLPNTGKYDVRRIRQHKLTAKITSDAAWIDTFYYQYYQPSMQIKHGDEAFVIPNKTMHSLMQTGNYEFVKIYDGEVCIAAVFAQNSNGKYYFFKVGWLNGDDMFVKKGASAAMYWYTIERAFALQCEQVILGGTPAYLENGVFKYKAKWLASFATKTYGLNKILLNPDNECCYSFLKQVSLLALNKNKKLIVLSSKTRDKTDVTGTVLNNVAAWYVLRESRSAMRSDDVKELPVALQYWYDRVDHKVLLSAL
jgi:hypothetical protein